MIRFSGSSIGNLRGEAGICFGEQLLSASKKGRHLVELFRCKMQTNWAKHSVIKSEIRHKRYTSAIESYMCRRFVDVYKYIYMYIVIRFVNNKKVNLTIHVGF